MAFGDRVRKMPKFKAVKCISTPEDWATVNELLIIDNNEVFVVTVHKLKPSSDRLINDKDRKETIRIRDMLIRMLNWHPLNWWLNYRHVIGFPYKKNKDNDLIIDIKNEIFYRG